MAGTAYRLERAKRKAHKALTEADHAKAWPWLSEILNTAWEDPQGLYMAGVFFRDQGHVGIAAHMFRRAVALDPEHPQPWLHFGACLHDMHYYAEAIEVFERVRTVLPGESVVYQNLAASHQQMGDFSAAYSYAKESLKRDPNRVGAKSVLAMASLGLERWQEGFDHYRYLLGSQVLIRTYGDENQAEWDGSPGQTVIVQGDQGLGDEIRFASMIPDAIGRCKKVVYDCHPKMVNVFRRSFAGADVYGTRKEKAVDWLDQYAFDARTNVSTLGRFFRTTPSAFPRKPYLVPCEERRAKWRAQLDQFPRPLVGVAWQGGSVGTLREIRSLDIEDLRPLTLMGGTFVDLSYHDSRAEVERFNRGDTKILRLDVDQSDYDDTLALVAELDLIITVPTAVMHAAGAIGKDAWVMVPKYPMWEFGAKRKDLIWYEPGRIGLIRAEPNQESSELMETVISDYGKYLDGKNIHWNRPAPSNRIHGTAKFDHQAIKHSGIDHSPIIVPTSNFSKRTDGVHF